jgi:probable HAF family extracellular repeat protein
MWQNGVMTNLGDLPLPGGVDLNRAYGVNDAGQVVGQGMRYSNTAQGSRAFLWENGVMTNLGALPSSGDYSYASGINNAGQVVGFSWAATGVAFIWQNGVRTSLGSLAGGGSGSSSAFGINNAGQVVGYSSSASGQRAFMWQNGVMTDLGGAPPVGEYVSARDINDVGQAVGHGVSDDEVNDVTIQRALLWQNGSMIDLSTAVGVAGTGWSLAEATAINDLGQIVGYGTNSQGEFHAFMLTPVPEPEVYLMMGVGVCLAGVIARRRKQNPQ